MDRLNYHHLRYFREVAVDGQLGRTADRLNLSQSALSMQIKALEESLGTPLFDRVSRKLVLTDAGRIALAHADQIFSAGEQLQATFSAKDFRAPLRVGAVSTLSRNFQLGFLRPLLRDGHHTLSLKSGSTEVLLSELRSLDLDVVLSTEVPTPGTETQFAVQRIAEQPVALHGTPDRMGHDTLQDLLTHQPIVLPTDSVIRAGFLALCDRLSLRPQIAAHVDDMAMVRLLAREGVGLALAPSVVVADELASGVLVTSPCDLGIFEPFYAVTLAHRFPHPALAGLLDATGSGQS